MDKLKLGSLITNAVLFITVLVLLRFVGCGHGKVQPCPEVGRKSDTVIVSTPSHDTLRIIAQGRPQVREVHQAVDYTLRRIDTATVVYNGKPEPIAFDQLDTLSYYDSIFKRDTCIITIRERVSHNAIVWRDLRYRDLHPDKWKVITNTVTVEKKQSLVKVYLGVDASYRPDHPDVGPGALVVVKDWVALNYNYQVLNSQHNLGAYIKISFKKK